MESYKQDVVFCVWLPSLSIMFPRFVHVVACVSISFLSTALSGPGILFFLFTGYCKVLGREQTGCSLEFEAFKGPWLLTTFVLREL